MANIAPLGKYRAFDDNGEPLAGGKLYTYEAGTTTPKFTYTTAEGDTENQNPVILDSAGYADVWLGDGGYKFALTDANDAPIFTVDNIGGSSDTAFGGTVYDLNTNTLLTNIYQNSIISASGNITLTLPSVSVSGNGWYVVVKNAGSGTITIAPDGGDALDVTSYAPGGGGIIYSNGTRWRTLEFISSLVVTTTGSQVLTNKTLTSPIINGATIATSTLTSPIINTSQSGTGTLYSPCEGRLTLTSSVPVTTSDVIGSNSVYFTPYKGNKIALYTAGVWVTLPFTQITISLLSGFASDKPYDVFAYNNAGTVALETLVWTNDTTRATALTFQDGVYCKSGDTTRRYIGTFYTTSTTTTEDSAAKRYVWNYYNRVERQMQVLDTTDSWSYSTATVRQARATATNQISYIQGVAEDAVSARVIGMASTSASTARTVTVGIGVDSTTAGINSPFMVFVAGIISSGVMEYVGYPGVGQHDLVWLEAGAGADTQTWYGDNGGAVIQSGIKGKILA